MSGNDAFQTSIFDGTEQSTLEQSLRLIRAFEEPSLHRNPIGYAVGYSGGKDSDALLHLFKMAGVKFFVFHNHTTLDAPETVYHVRKVFKKLEEEGIPCKIFMPKISFWGLCLQEKILPTRWARFCCRVLKEDADQPELKFATRSFGVRKAESVKRAAKRDSIEMRDRKDFSDFQKFHFDNAEEVKETTACYTKKYFIVNPIAYWSDNYLWEFIRSEHIEVNPRYAEGFSRVGCIGCPFCPIKAKLEDLKRYPKYRDRYIRLCNDILTERARCGWDMRNAPKNGEEFFENWLYDRFSSTDEAGGGSLFEE